MNVGPRKRGMAIVVALGRWLGLVLHAVMLPIFILQGLNVPTEGVLLLVGLWVVLLVGIALLWRRAPLLVPLVPIVDAFLVYGVTAAGRALFNWQG